MDTKIVAAYVRVSTSKDQTTESQLLEITNHLKSKAIYGFQVYNDVGYSGTKKNRPDLKRLMADCRKGKVSMVVCYKLDRLFRSLKDLMDTLAEFQALGVEFVALKDGIDLSTATGRLMMQIIGAFAEFEAAVIKERVLSGLANARSKGVKLGRPFKKGHGVVKKMKSEGSSVVEIAAHTGLSKKSVYRTLGKQE
jgi:DNA invertase Pin-like site-specific DNA recombinase